ncbi:MAG: threonine synthase [unclassified Hahellaceae]|nr:threonine synthase [Hahellaceae bacterium]
MKYISTRGQAPALNFEEVVLTGLAPDGGLYVPTHLPEFSVEKLQALQSASYQELAVEVMLPFIGDSIDRETFTEMVHDTYAAFNHDAIAPLKQLEGDVWLLELFHGPTLAFKDFALQLLGRLFDYFLAKRQQKVVIMGATSGDTGSAAIDGCKRSAWVDMFILHPHGRVSEVQRRQMTSILEPNVFNIAVEGNFDDCQRMVKASFADQRFLKGRQLVAVNSINWARIMAQIVYYFYAALRLGAPSRSVAFSVPTGNFGDIFAGYLAKQMGLPITQLVVATNRNDILHRFLASNRYEQAPLEHTLSPSMDIVVSSNFERLLFDLHHRDGEALADLMTRMNKETVSIADVAWQKARALFDSAAVSDEETTRVIGERWKRSNELLDPHTAIGYKAAVDCRRDPAVPMVVLGTAHPAKFAEAVRKSGAAVEPVLPPFLADLMDREERFEVLPNDLAAVQSAMVSALKL